MKHLPSFIVVFVMVIATAIGFTLLNIRIREAGNQQITELTEKMELAQNDSIRQVNAKFNFMEKKLRWLAAQSGQCSPVVYVTQLEVLEDWMVYTCKNPIFSCKKGEIERECIVEVDYGDNKITKFFKGEVIIPIDEGIHNVRLAGGPR